MLYFMRSFKPALARDYDVFFAAIGLLCGGILFFQGWRLDPILQFGQFLLAGTTVFFAYESVRLRGVATEQARRSAYFDDEPAPARGGPNGDLRGGWDDPYDRFDEPQPVRRRFSARDDDPEDQPQEDFYRPRRNNRAAIPEQAASRRRPPVESESGNWDQQDERSRRMARFRAGEDNSERLADFGDRRNQRQDLRRGSRPIGRTGSESEPKIPAKGSPVRPSAEEAAFTPRQSARSQSPNREGAQSKSSFITPQGNQGESGPNRRPMPRNRQDANSRSDANSQAASNSQPASNSQASSNSRSASNSRQTPRSSRPRDNSSRFDD